MIFLSAYLIYLSLILLPEDSKQNRNRKKQHEHHEEENIF